MDSSVCVLGGSSHDTVTVTILKQKVQSKLSNNVPIQS